MRMKKIPLPALYTTWMTNVLDANIAPLTCPYDVPKYSADLGIVRKCDMCSQRLSAGEAPRLRTGLPEPGHSNFGGEKRGRNSP